MLLPMNWIKQLDEYGRAGTPCLFILDFELKKPLVLPLNAVNGEAIRFNFRGMTNSTAGSASYPMPVHFNATPPDFQKYHKAFDLVMAALQYGNSYLLNLTFPTRLETNLDLPEIFNRSKAPYRLWLKDRCMVPIQFSWNDEFYSRERIISNTGSFQCHTARFPEVP